MRRDSIFYKLFKQFPSLLFELVDQKPLEAENYQFDSIEVKETAFRIDGVFLPPDHANPKIAFFAIEAMLEPITEEPRAVREWKEEAEKMLVIRQLKRRFGKIPDVLLPQIQQLTREQTETLAEDLLDFSVLGDLENWLQHNQQQI